MIESYPLITTIVASVVAAFLLGLIVNRLGLPAILGYLCAGMMIGPHTPGFVANIELAKQLAEIGIILLMFGVGLHFSVKDLVQVNKIATPRALLQITFTTIIGIATAMLMGHSFLEGIIFGLAISVASTVVLIRSLEHYHMVSSNVGKIAVGWLIVEDIVMVLAIVLLPIVADTHTKQSGFQLNEILYQIFFVLLKIAAFAILMVFAARKVLPNLLIYIAKTKSIELMSLGTLSIALGFAFIAYTIFGASFALGAFLAGLVLNESDIGRKAAKQSLPLRDTFAVLFFISVGMLFDPSVITREPLMVLATFAIIVIAKPFAAYFITRLFGHSVADSFIIAVSLGQIGEFSFIISGLALKIGVFSQHLSDLILAGAILSIACNPFLFKIAKNFQSSNRIFLPNFH